MAVAELLSSIDTLPLLYFFVAFESQRFNHIEREFRTMRGDRFSKLTAGLFIEVRRSVSKECECAFSL